MKRITLIVLLITLFSSGSASAANAYWTGRSEFANSVTYRAGYNCEYAVNGFKFWRFFTNYCPSMIEVE